jgi:hypothetical protein
VFEQHAAGHPDDRGHTCPEQERRERDAFVVGAGRGETFGEIAFRL